MPMCGECGFEAKNAAGLGGHRRAKHPLPPAPVSVVEAVFGEIRGREDHPLAATAVMLARAMDESESARDLPKLAAELRATLVALGEPASEQEDPVDELTQRRRARRAAAAEAVGSAGGDV